MKKFSKFLVLFAAMAFLYSCSSSYKVASSFGKRKYLKGHFFNPLANLKMKYEHNSGQWSVVNGQSAANTESVALIKTASIPLKIVHNTLARVNLITSKSKTSGGSKIAKEPTTFTNNVSLKENSFPVAGYSSHSQKSFQKQGKYLLYWLVCFGVFLIILLAATIVGLGGGNFSAVTILTILAIVALIAAIVYFLLWLMSLSKKLRG